MISITPQNNWFSFFFLLFKLFFFRELSDFFGTLFVFFWEGECFTTFKFCFLVGCSFRTNLGTRKGSFFTTPLYGDIQNVSLSLKVLESYSTWWSCWWSFHILGTSCLPQLDREISFNSRTIYIPSGFAGFCLILPGAMTMMNSGLQGLLVGMILCFISPSHASDWSSNIYRYVTVYIYFKQSQEASRESYDTQKGIFTELMVNP